MRGEDILLEAGRVFPLRRLDAVLPGVARGDDAAGGAGWLKVETRAALRERPRRRKKNSEENCGGAAVHDGEDGGPGR